MTSPTSLPSFAAPTPPSRRQLTKSALAAIGVEAEQDDDGDLLFVVQDHKLYARTSDEGPGLLRVFGQWQIDENLGDEGLRYGAAHHVTATHALVKVNVLESTLVVAADSLVPDGSRYDVLVPASIDAVLSAVDLWHRLVAEAAGQAGLTPEAG